MTNKSYFITSVISILLVGCEKFVETAAPVNFTSSDKVFKDVRTANAALLGVYGAMSSDPNFFSSATGISAVGGMLADEFVSYAADPQINQLHDNEISTTNYVITNFWQELYSLIYRVNDIIEGVEKSELPGTVKEQLVAESRFLRAYFYFYLVNLFGDVPLITSVDYASNSKLPRSDVEEIYAQILQDLTHAEEKLPTDFSSFNGERIRATRYAAQALLSRVYLYTHQWELAIAKSSAVINEPAFSLEPGLETVFLKNSNEAIWQLQSVAVGYNTLDGNAFIIPSGLNGVSNFLALPETLYDFFDDADNRKSIWIGNYNFELYFPYKYKVERSFPGQDPTEYQMMLRLSEQYLIRAEANGMIGRYEDATTDLNVVRERAGLDPIILNNQSEVLAAVEDERRRELFTESAHRWFDLKRWHRSDEVLGLVKPNWQPSDSLLPIPQNELQRAPQLSQNPGY
jgi:hypothetical protein